MGTSWWSQTQSGDLELQGREFSNILRRGPKLLAVATIFLIGGAFTALSISNDPNEPYQVDNTAWVKPASVEATLQQCGGTFGFNIGPQDYGVLSEGEYSASQVPRHDYIIPAYGYMAPRIGNVKQFNAATDDNLPNYQEILRLMYEGKKIIWYADTGDANLEDEIRSFLDDHEDFIAMPWNLESSGKLDNDGKLRERNLPEDRLIGYGAWGFSKSCGAWNAEVAEEFSNFVKQNEDMSKFPLRIAKVADNGRLPAISGR